jgi:ABC-type transport system involved in multi-copper enzyme maturation permease subunit
MHSGTLALLTRALRMDARLARGHLLRLVFAGFIYLCLINVQFASLSFGAPGLKLFQWLTWLNMACITLAGVGFFATAITEEKEEETLGLLKMAGLNPVSILLGKSTSRLLSALLLLLVQFPFVLLAITLGGVTMVQVAAAYCSLAAFLVLVANLGLLCSVCCRRSGSAAFANTLLLAAYYGGAALLRESQGAMVQLGWIPASGWLSGGLERCADLMEQLSIARRLSDVMITGFDGSPIGTQVVGSLLASALCFGMAWGLFDYFTNEGRFGAARLESLLQLRPLRRKKGSTLGRAWDMAIAWKDFHFVAGGKSLFIGKFVVYGLIVGVLLYLERIRLTLLATGWQSALIAMVAAVVIESCIYASRIFHDEWREHTLPLLLMLPTSTARIAWLKTIGCLPALAPALFWIFVCWVGIVADDPGNYRNLFAPVLPSVWCAVLVFTVFLHLTALLSLVVRWGALPLAIGVMVLLAGFSNCCLFPVYAIVFLVASATGSEEAAYLCADAFLVCVIAALQTYIRLRLEHAASQ